jgi:hypothetical protein
MKYDGSINIDTKVDESGFNRGTAKLGASLKNIGRVMKTAFAIGVAGVAALVVGVVAAGRFLSDLGKTILDVMGKTVQYGGKIKELKKSFADLKNSFYSAFVGIFSIFIPYIQTAVMWLTKLLDTTAMVIAALLGQKTIMRAVTQSTEDQAKATKKTAKEARGALAAFDEINVLQQQNKDESGLDNIEDGISTVTVPIDKGISAFVDGVKEKFRLMWQSVKDFFAPLTEPLSRLGNAFKGLGEAIGKAFKPVVDWLDEKSGGVLSESLKGWRNLAILGIEFLTEKIIELTEWIEKNPEAFRAWAVAILVVLGALALIFVPIVGIIALIGALIVVIGFLASRFESIPDVLKEALRSAMMIMAIFGLWIQNTFLNPIKSAFDSALNWIGDKWESVFNGMKSFAKNTINTIIDFINGMVRAFASGINGVIGGLNSIHVSIPDWIPGVGGQSWGLNIPRVSAPQIPRLATGAVIPPNAEFMAVLGDQKSGTNIETPEALLRQIVQEELGNIKADIEIKFGGSLGALVRDLKPYIDKENVRIGNSLVRSAV